MAVETTPKESIFDDVVNAFRNKATFMKTWKPASAPSNRDRLELYSLHKQAISGNAPSPSVAGDFEGPAEKAKYNAWRSKAGLDATEAMRRYIVECDRQIQMYGTAQIVQTSTTTSKGISNIESDLSVKGKDFEIDTGKTNQVSMQSTSHPPPSHATTAYQTATATAASTTLRGLAAIPLICAAASEDRHAYLRRLHRTPAGTVSWWRRQEPLTATPGSVAALPEFALLTLAAFIEYLSLSVNNPTGNLNDSDASMMADASPADDSDELLAETSFRGVKNFLSLLMPPPAVVQSFFWPLHNCLLAVWIEIILIHAILTGAFDCIWTVLWGSRSTGKTVSTIWNQHVRLAAIQSVQTISDLHQPITARFVGLLMWPIHVLVDTISALTIDGDDNMININTASRAYTSTTGNLNANIWTCLLYTCAVTITWWYWIIVLPWITFLWLIAAFWIGGSCFAIIELAGV